MPIGFCSHEGCSDFAEVGTYCARHAPLPERARRYNRLGQQTGGMAVECVTTGDVFGSIIEAAGAFGVCANVVRRSCDTGLPTAKGLEFKRSPR